MVFLSWLLRFLLHRIPFVRAFEFAFGLLLFFGILLYVLESIGLYTMGRAGRVRASFLAWIPGAQLYVLGALSDRSSGRPFLQVLLPGLEIGAAACILSAGAASGWLFAAATIFVAALAVFYFRALYLVYYQYARAAAAMLVLSIVFFFLPPFFLFFLRTRKPFRYSPAGR